MLLPLSLISVSLKQLSRDITNGIIVRQNTLTYLTSRNFCQSKDFKKYP